MAVLDAELDMLLSRWMRYRTRREGAPPIDSGEFLNIAVVFSGDAATLTSAGLTVTSIVGPTAYGSATIEGLEALSRLSQVSQIERLRRAHISLDGSVPAIKANKVWGRSGDHFSGYTGNGVVVGIVDTGIDFRHRTFRRPDFNTRILKIWDQTLIAEGGETVPGPITDILLAPPIAPVPLGYGVEYSSAQINAAMDSAPGSAPARHVDQDGHGTHVAGIAAGDGSQGGHCHGEYTYVGVASDADIIAVRLWGLVDADKKDSAGNRRNAPAPALVVDAILYIFNEARKAGKAAVVNLSIGKFTEFMGGQSAVSQSIDSIFTLNSVGHAVVFAAGNDGDAAFHAAATVPPGPANSLSLRFRTHAEDTEKRTIKLFYTGANLKARLTSPVAGADGVIEWVDPADVGASTTANGNFNGGVDKGRVDISNNANQITIVITPPPDTQNVPPKKPTNKAGVWTLELLDTTGAATPIDGFCLYGSSHDPQSVNWLDHVVTGQTLDEYATGREIIAVGACQDEGQLTGFSARGPTRDVGGGGRAKPDLAAPGYQIASAAIAKDRSCENCCCACCHDFYVDKNGTSMAAPHVAGAIALMLHKNPTLTHTQIKDLLTANTTAKPAGSSPDQDAGWGAGRLNIEAAVGAAAQVNAPIARVVAEEALMALQSTLVSTARGPQLAGLFRAYASEVWSLIQQNRRVATMWHRVKGPIWTRLALRAAHMPDAGVPLQIDDLHFRDALKRFAVALKRFGSQALKQDVALWENEVMRIEDGMTLRDIIRAIGDQPPPSPVAA